MEIIPLLIKEIEQEAVITRKFLQRVPIDHPDYKPHPKSMALMPLVTHIADLAGWPAFVLGTSELDFASQPYEPAQPGTNDELIGVLEKGVKESLEALKNATEEDLLAQWTLRHGDTVLAKWSKYEAIRHALAQIAHHRAQLGVYLRLLNIPVPGSYGPSADEQ